MKRIVSVAALLLAFAGAFAQTATQNTNNTLGKLGLSGSVGTDGIGLELSSKINQYLRVRAGFSYMPKFDYNMNFDVQVGDTKESKYDAAGNRVETKFDRLAQMMKSLTGIEVNDQIKMVGEPKMCNAKVLLDVYPLRNKHWHVTAGFYWGSSTIAKATNSMEDMSSLLAICIYNEMYDKALNDDPIISVGGMDIYRPDLVNYGCMGVNVGQYADGTNYVMEPDANGMVSARIKVNKFKPYVGVGYDGTFRRTKRWCYGVDGGVMMWGGSPKVLIHDGTDLAKDIVGIDGKVGKYVDFCKAMKVYPTLNFRISHNIL
jgi:hypothetical protein